ncbi:MAG: amylo-alpha-1,6-glucosidase [Acidobacteriota bacterium]|nr:amylo-alpha-1,6-glucosidase [Acidobacteriota bacterium]
MPGSPAFPEWLEADGRGGFASGTTRLFRTRRYHALLLVATDPPAGRFVLVNGIEAWVETPSGRVPISAQAYGPDVPFLDGAGRVAEFEADPWPRWTFRLPGGGALEQEIFVSRARGTTALGWQARGGGGGATLAVRLLLSGRDAHALHHENRAFSFDPHRGGVRTVYRPYPGVPAIAVDATGEYTHDPVWYRNFLYAEERERGLDFLEDLASPGVFHFDLAAGPAVLLLSDDPDAPLPDSAVALREEWAALRDAESRRRGSFRSRLDRAADDYVVRRRDGRTIIAGYPWFLDWGRDTFISLRGLCLATGRLAEAGAILATWAGMVSEGMLPNRFPDTGRAPEYNSVDAALWFAVAVHDYLAACERGRRRVPAEERSALEGGIDAVLAGYSSGTRHGIRADADGLLTAGEPGIQLTWMDAKVGGRVVTPRMGKPVEVQALWINALRIGGSRPGRWRALAERALSTFSERFWNEESGCLFDVVDADGRPGNTDASVRPNQIFAVGGLPFPLLEGDRARRVVRIVESRLVTPAGVRSLCPNDPAYVGRYEDGVESRDGAYHQGTVWPWLLGAFAHAFVRTAADPEAARREARERFLVPLLERPAAGLGHLPEIADGDPPHAPRGCPFQAWSVGEALRLDQEILAAGRREDRGRSVR